MPVVRLSAGCDPIMVAGHAAPDARYVGADPALVVVDGDVVAATRFATRSEHVASPQPRRMNATRHFGVLRLEQRGGLG